YLVDVAKGAVVWSSAPLIYAYVLGANGAGEFLMMANVAYVSFFSTAADFSLIDGAGTQRWTAHITDGNYGSMWLVAWPGGGEPWLPLADVQTISPRNGYVGTPPTWFGGAMTTAGGFVLDSGAGTRLTVHAIHAGAVVADASFDEFPPSDGVKTFPF